MFSSRLPHLAPNALSRAIGRARASGRPLLDLTETNPTRVGLELPAGLLAPLGDDAGRTYVPEPRGLSIAREAVAGQFARAGVRADPDRIVLTPGTSDAYGLLFKLLCDPGDVVLAPVPSYPLFELLTAFEGAAMRSYRLDRDSRWRIDRPSLEEAATDRTRAVLVVSPNNPTGSMLHADDRDWLTAWCVDRGIAIIADEVFGHYPLRPAADAVSLAGHDATLTFTLGGLSKSAGLPQVKVAWTLVSGPDGLVDDALTRLDLLCDTYLSVSTPGQLALPHLIASGAGVRAQIARRLERNLAALEKAVAAWPGVGLELPEGGWSAVLRVPAVEAEEAMAMRLLDEVGIVVHPGFFFDFPAEAYLVVSLLPEPAIFDGGISALLGALREAR